MKGKLRYVLIVAAALLIVGLTILFTLPKDGNKSDPSGDSSSENIQDDTEENTLPEETTMDSGELSSEEDHHELVTFEPTEPEPSITGLRKYFRGKLVINMEKVHLYLNVRREANDESEILAVLWPADIVSYDGRQGEWLRVVMDGYHGFVHADYVLTDDDAFAYRKSSVGYAATVKENSTGLYSTSDRTERIASAYKGDTFRIVGVTSDCFKLAVVYNEFETLFVKQTDVIPYYLFQSPDDTSGLAEWEEDSMATMEISDNISRSRQVVQEANEEKAIYESIEASLIAESKREEAERLAQRSREAAEASRRAATAWQNSVVTAEPGETANEEGRTYLGTFRITGYCHCTRCCGVWGHDDPNYQAHGASGIDLIPDYSVAVNPAQIAYGTRLYVVRRDNAGNIISEHEYLAADEGVDPYCLDLYKRLHSEASAVGMYFAEVYRID